MGAEGATAAARTVNEIALAVDGIELPGRLAVPDGPIGLVVFAHGSGSSRRSPRNRFVADRLGERRFATLLFDLLTEREAIDRRLVFDIELLARRLAGATRAVRASAPVDTVAALPVGLFGASTGAAAALVAATDPDLEIAAVVSRGGRPDLAGPHLPRVTTPTLLVVGGADVTVLDLNRRARERLGGPSELVVVPGASHLFEEPGTLERVADLAADWFERTLGGGPR